MRRWMFSLSLVSLALAGCTTGGIPADGGPLPDVGPARIDAGPRPQRDAGDALRDVLIYAHSPDTLYTFSPFTNMVTEIGVFEDTAGGTTIDMTDLAVDSMGEAFVCGQDDALYALNVDTAEVTLIGSLGLPDGEHIFALSFLPPGESPNGREMMVGATNEGVIFEVNRATGATSELGRYPDGWGSSGDIVSVAGLGTFATLRSSTAPEADVLAQIVFSSDGSSDVMVRGAIRNSDENFRSIYGLGYWGADVYGFSTTGQLIRIDKDDGRAELVSTATGADQFWGAGVTTQVPFLF